MRDAVQKIRRAVQWIDNPAVPRVRSCFRTALLEQHCIAWARPLQLGLERALGLQIGSRDEFARALDRDLELLDLAKVANEAARCLQRGVSHDIEDR